jgi:hypothetical protein
MFTSTWFFLAIISLLIGVLIYFWQTNKKLQRFLDKKSGEVPPRVPISWGKVIHQVVDFADVENMALSKDILLLDEDYNYYWRVTELRIIEDRPVLVLERL